MPQGWIIGPALFLLYLDDLPDAVKSSRIAMFAGETKIFRAINSAADSKSLQQELSNLASWSTASGLGFNQSKCLSRKTKPLVTTYKMNDSFLKSPRCQRDLGVLVYTDLTWTNMVSNHIDRASKLLGFIKRNARSIQSIAVRELISLTLGTLSPSVCKSDLVATVCRLNC